MKCSAKINVDIFKCFYALPDKDSQDLYLQGTVVVVNVKQERRRNPERKKRDISYANSVQVGFNKIKVCFNKIKVCQGALLNIHTVDTVERMKRIKRLLRNNEIPIDKRRKHPKGNAVTADVIELIKNHISLYPVKESHCAGREFQYLDGYKDNA